VEIAERILREKVELVCAIWREGHRDSGDEEVGEDQDQRGRLGQIRGFSPQRSIMGS